MHSLLASCQSIADLFGGGFPIFRFSQENCFFSYVMSSGHSTTEGACTAIRYCRILLCECITLNGLFMKAVQSSIGLNY